MARAGPRKTPRYSPEFKLTAVRLSQQPGIQVQAVAAALDIHPSRAGVWPAAGGARAPKKSHPVLFRTKAEKFGFIETQRGAVAVSRLWALYGVTRAGYYAWRSRPASARAVQDRTLSERLRALFAAHGGRYGSPRLHRELRRVGCGISRRRVERLMRMAGLRARVVQIYRANPGLHRFYGQHPNRLPAGGARRRDQVWLGDITYLRLGPGWRFLAIVLDQYSRRMLAWRLSRRRDADLTRTVLNAAVRRRRPRSGLIFHSDRGSEYAAAMFRDRVQLLGMQQSSAQRGPEDNAHMESFFHSLKAEVVHGTTAATDAALRQLVAGYIRYYNHRRLHSALRYRSPVEFERSAA